jgi:hypothetical protein
MAKFFNTFTNAFAESNNFLTSLEEMQNDAVVKTQFSDIEKVHGMIDTATKDAETLDKLQEITQDGVSQQSLEQISLLVENICHRQGMVFRPKYFSVENFNYSGKSYAVEGLGSFLKSVIDAIIKAVLKMINWVTALFTGGDSSSPLRTIERKIKKSEDILDAISPEAETKTKDAVSKEGLSRALALKKGSELTQHTDRSQSASDSGGSKLSKFIRSYQLIIEELNHSSDFNQSVDVVGKKTTDYLQHMHEVAGSFSTMKIENYVGAENAASFKNLVEKMFSKFDGYRHNSGKTYFSTAFQDVEISSVGEDEPMRMVFDPKKQVVAKVEEDDVERFFKQNTKKSLTKIVQLAQIRIQNLNDSGNSSKKALLTMNNQLKDYANKVSQDSGDGKNEKKTLLEISKVLTFVVRLLSNSVTEVSRTANYTEQACQLYSNIVKSA